MSEIEVMNSDGVIGTVEIVLKQFEKQQTALNQKTQQIAYLAKKLNAEKAVCQNLREEIEREKKELESQNEFHVDSIMELQKMNSDLNERHVDDMDKVNELQEQNRKLKEALKVQTDIIHFDRTQLTMLRRAILQTQTEADRLQDEMSNYTRLSENTSSFHDNSTKSGTTICYIFYL